MEQEEVEKLYEVAERWHIGVGVLLDEYEKTPNRSLDRIAIDIVRERKARLKELLEKQARHPLDKDEYMERVTLELNFS